MASGAKSPLSLSTPGTIVDLYSMKDRTTVLLHRAERLRTDGAAETPRLNKMIATMEASLARLQSAQALSEVRVHIRHYRAAQRVRSDGTRTSRSESRAGGPPGSFIYLYIEDAAVEVVVRHLTEDERPRVCSKADEPRYKNDGSRSDEQITPICYKLRRQESL